MKDFIAIFLTAAVFSGVAIGIPEVSQKPYVFFFVAFMILWFVPRCSNYFFAKVFPPKANAKQSTPKSE